MRRTYKDSGPSDPGGRFMEGEIARLTLPIVIEEDRLVPYWQIRFVQDGDGAGGPVYHAQAVPLGVWPGLLRWLPHDALQPTGIATSIVPFDVQEAIFRSLGIPGILAARRAPLILRTPLPEEDELVHQLVALRVPYRGIAVTDVARAEDVVPDCW